MLVQSADPDKHRYAVTVHTVRNENVMATTRGVIVSTELLADNAWSVTLQTGSFVTRYRGMVKVLKAQGASVEKGETIGLMDNTHDLQIELWDAGRFVNPEEVIVW